MTAKAAMVAVASDTIVVVMGAAAPPKVPAPWAACAPVSVVIAGAAW